jgi:hypothetical protein
MLNGNGNRQGNSFRHFGAIGTARLRCWVRPAAALPSSG